jgi:MurNAc alpha-1-phosphate uridylyltransferase
MSIRPRTAMLLAAGYGTRMRPLTDHTPKPLLPLGGRPLLDHALARLAEAGVETVVVNGFWQVERLAAHLDARAHLPPRTVLRREAALLETGGGVRAALPLLGADPFFVVNGDAFWVDGPRPALARLADAFDDDVDAVLLVHRTFQVHADVGFGDFALDPWGRLRRRQEREIVPYIFAGVQLIRPSLLAGTPEGPFSMNLAWDRALEHGRLRGVVHDGLWFHLSTPADLSEAESLLHARQTGETR